jgi:hypothetical protein
LVLSLGILGAVLLVLCAAFLTPGKYILVPYIVLMLSAAAVIRGAKIPSFRDRFFVGFGSFMLASLALYFAIAIMIGSFQTIDLLGHLWRIGLLALVALSLNAGIARVTEPA